MTRQRIRRLMLEELEDRVTPAVLIEIGIDLDGDNALDDVRVTGTTENTFVRIVDEGAGAGSLTISVDKNGDFLFGPNDVENLVLAVNDDTSVIEMNLGDGDDAFVYELADKLQVSTRDLLIDLGGGLDFFSISAESKAMESATVFNLDLLTGPGKDELDIRFADVVDSSLNVDVSVGGGSDQVTLQFLKTGGNPQIASDAVVQIDLDLGTGNNQLLLALKCDVGATGQATLDVDVIGGNVATQSDQVQVVLLTDSGNGTAVSRLSLDVALNDGPDSLAVGVQLVDIQARSLVEISARGGLGDDEISVNYQLTSVSTIAAGATFVIDVSGGAGNDIMAVLLNANSFSPLTLQGLLRIQITGNDGNDEITHVVKVGNSSAGVQDIGILAGSGNDEVTYNFLKGSSTVTLAPTGKARLNGGKGSDTVDVASDAALVDARLFETFV